MCQFGISVQRFVEHLCLHHHGKIFRVNTVCDLMHTACISRDIDQAVKRYHFSVESWALSRLTKCETRSGRGFSPSFFGFPLTTIFPPLPHTHLWPHPEACNSPDQAAYCSMYRRCYATTVFEQRLGTYAPAETNIHVNNIRAITKQPPVTTAAQLLRGRCFLLGPFPGIYNENSRPAQWISESSVTGYSLQSLLRLYSHIPKYVTTLPHTQPLFELGFHQWSSIWLVKEHGSYTCHKCNDMDWISSFRTKIIKLLT
jgi:hypothetical protein